MLRKFSVVAVCAAIWPALAYSAPSSDQEMVVTAHRFAEPVSSILAPVTVVTRNDIDRWQVKSVPDILRRLPGIDIVMNGGLGQLSTVMIRGADSRQSLILINGIRLNQSGVSGTVDLSQIPLSMIQKIEYIRGPRSAVYGSDAIGGVINIITGSDKLETTLSAGMGSNAYQSYKTSTNQKIGEATTVNLAGSYTYSRGFDVVAGTTKESDRDGYQNKFVSGGAEHQFSSQWQGFIQGYGFQNRSGYDGWGNNTRKLYSQTFDSGVRFQQDAYSSQLRGTYSHTKEFNYDDKLGPYQGAFTLDESEQYNLQWGNSYQLEQGLMSSGLDWQSQSLQPKTAGVADKRTLRNTGLYLSGQKQWQDWLFEASLRGDDNSQFGWHTTWQTSAGWELVEGYRLIAGYGTAFKAPNMGQLYSKSYGNPYLKPEESRQWEIGLEGHSEPLVWRLSAYQNDVTDFINFIKHPITRQNSYYNVGEVRIRGVEWTGSFETGPFEHQISLTYLEPKDRKKDEILARRAKQQVKYQLDVSFAEVDWSVNYQYLGERYDIAFDQNFNAMRFKTGGVSLWDIAASYPLTSELTVRGRIGNLFDKKYETAYGYKTPGREYFLTASYTF